MARVLVTGATGFVGSALVTRLVELGYQVRVLVRPTSDTRDLPPGVDLAMGDITARESLVEGARGAEIVFHMAALVQAWAKDPKQFERVNVGGVQNVLHVLRTVPSVRRVVYTSTFFALGPTAPGVIADESHEHKGAGFFTEYERTKYMADVVVRRAVVEEGLDVVLVYPGVVYGPGKIVTGNLLVTLIVDHFRGRLPGLIGSGTKLNSFVHINDVVAAMLAASERGVAGRRYVLAGEVASMARVFDVVQEVTGKAPPRLRIPLWVAKVLGFVSVLVARLGGPVPIFTPRSVEALACNWAYSSSLAEADLGFKPLPLRDGLGETLAWLHGTQAISY